MKGLDDKLTFLKLKKNTFLQNTLSDDDEIHAEANILVDVCEQIASHSNGRTIIYIYLQQISFRGPLITLDGSISVSIQCQ